MSTISLMLLPSWGRAYLHSSWVGIGSSDSLVTEGRMWMQTRTILESGSWEAWCFLLVLLLSVRSLAPWKPAGMSRGYSNHDEQLKPPAISHISEPTWRKTLQSQSGFQRTLAPANKLDYCLMTDPVRPYNRLQVHPLHQNRLEFVPFYGRVIFHCIYEQLYPFIVDGHLGCFHVLRKITIVKDTCTPMSLHSLFCNNISHS